MNLLTIAHENTKRYLENIIDYDWSDEALDNRVEKGLEIEFCSEMIKKGIWRGQKYYHHFT